MPKFDVNQNAKSIVDALTAYVQPPSEDERKAAAKMLGRMGGLKGGPARKAALSQKRRTEIAKKAAAKRWGKKKGAAKK